MTLTSQEFLRRFVQHILPRGFPRIRYFGWLSNRMRARILPLCRAQLNQAPLAEIPAVAKPTLWSCTHCHGLIHLVEPLSAAQLFFTERTEFHTFDSS
jgi:Putative transposase